ncbi:hypothetical protein [Nocardia sp. NPDC004123]
MVAALGVAGLLGVAKLVPDLPRPEGVHLRHELAALGAFNLGNAISAWLGGLVIAAGFGYPASNWVGAALAVSALLRACLSEALERRAAQQLSTFQTNQAYRTVHS